MIKIDNLWERYRVKFIKDGAVFWEEIEALQGVNFNVSPGEVVGIIGENGAGKTTLLRLIAGMLLPDKGDVQVNGRVSALMELGAGFNPEFTGRENILINGRVYGLSENELKEITERIIEFAGLGKFIDAPIKYYSQGMYMRLAFSLAIYVDPDILLIDDILSVGDEEAQQKCVKKVFELKKAGKTIILVSHNLKMVNELCDRVVLLEKGKVILEGLPEEVLSRYLNTVGKKEGIAVLTRDNLRAVFNNGRITFFYDGINVNKGEGFYVSYLLPASGIKVSSFNFDWQINNLSEDEIRAEARTSAGVITQIWNIKIHKNELLWSVTIKDSPVKDPHIDVLLEHKYVQWKGLERNGKFPLFAHKINWQEIDAGNEDKIVGIIPNKDENDNMPFLVFEKQNQEGEFKLFNAGYQQEARVVQLLLPENNFSAGLKFFSSAGEFENYLKKKADVFKNKDKEYVKSEESCIAGAGDFRFHADIKNKSLRVYFKDKELTANKGLHGAVYTGDRIHCNSFEADWRVNKVSGNQLELVLHYERVPLSQFWRFVCENDQISVSIENDVRDEFLLIGQFVRMEIANSYGKWITPYEEGVFSANEYIESVAPIRLKDCKVSNISLLPKCEGYPRLSFNSGSWGNKQILSMHMYKCQKSEYSSFNFNRVSSMAERTQSPGRYKVFEGEIVVNRKVEPVGESFQPAAIVLADEDPRFVFDQGRVKICSGKRELTSGLGVYTSARCSGIWFDSYQALWDVIERSENRIVAIGSWPYIPISQTWHMDLIDKGVFQWIVEMEMYENIRLELEQASIMLSSEYEIWEAKGHGRGEFLDEFTQDYDILPFRLSYSKADTIEVKDAREILPVISFKSSGSSFRAIVENSDYFYKARLMQFQKSNVFKNGQRKYRYFQGVIKIADKR